MTQYSEKLKVQINDDCKQSISNVRKFLSKLTYSPRSYFFYFLFQNFQANYQKNHSYSFHDYLTYVLRPYPSFKYIIHKSNFSLSNICYKHTQCLLSDKKVAGRVRPVKKDAKSTNMTDHLQVPMFFLSQAAQ